MSYEIELCYPGPLDGERRQVPSLIPLALAVLDDDIARLVDADTPSADPVWIREIVFFPDLDSASARILIGLPVLYRPRD